MALPTVEIPGLPQDTGISRLDKIPVYDSVMGTLDHATVEDIIETFITGGGVLATGGFTLTLPAAGVAALLAAANVFTNLQTVQPSATNVIGLKIDMPSGSGQEALYLQYNGAGRQTFTGSSALNTHDMLAFDAGAGVASHYMRIGRNSNATTPVPGTLRLMDKAGATRFYWVGVDQKLHQALNAAPTTDDTIGTIVGDQVSWHEAKDVLGEVIDTASALARILTTPVYRWQYKNSPYFTPDGNPQEFTGIVGYDRHDWTLKGCGPDQTPVLNEISILGNLILAVREMAARNDALESRLAKLEQRLIALESAAA